MAILLSAELTGVPPASRGKVRDIFHIDDKLLIVATDRISAFDVVLPDGIPDKGRVLTQMSKSWFDRFSKVIPNHVIATDMAGYPSALRPFREQIEGRSMLVKCAEPLPVECVVRGYIAGGGWKEYLSTGQVCGVKLPKGLRQAQKLPEPIFTPTTKAQSGHDQSITMEQVGRMVGESTARTLAETSIRIYNQAVRHAESCGIIIADTKFEFGYYNGQLMLIDEVLTPDSSRFWDVNEHRVGESPPSFDKQYVRDYLETLDWDKMSPGPRLSEEVIEGTADRYREAFRRITGQELN